MQCKFLHKRSLFNLQVCNAIFKNEIRLNHESIAYVTFFDCIHFLYSGLVLLHHDFVNSLDQYKKLGLASKPNTGDNGVHASASPFEALAERNNWLGKSIEDDLYGKGLLAASVPLDTIKKWSGDCQVAVEGETKDGKTMSVFDTLEDLDADTILAKVSKISK